MYRPGLIPGLVQTREYTKSALSQRLSSSGTVDDVDAAVDGRIRRQHVLEEDGHEFVILVHRSGADDGRGRRNGNAGQLRHLLDIASPIRDSCSEAVPLVSRFVHPTTCFVLSDQGSRRSRR
ncbi:Scr1 family TA system antitoxin-like transcriptional regulator [Nocardia sp. NPDC004068]|uniref:Scr1 family TA system antitoxin-like transcriptional regulator n=1 Tax=Nocardia sp. NPDC004068 TaxID=3364303 RepID=UPI0036B52D9F